MYIRNRKFLWILAVRVVFLVKGRSLRLLPFIGAPYSIHFLRKLFTVLRPTGSTIFPCLGGRHNASTVPNEPWQKDQTRVCSQKTYCCSSTVKLIVCDSFDLCTFGLCTTLWFRHCMLASLGMVSVILLCYGFCNSAGPTFCCPLNCLESLCFIYKYSTLLVLPFYAFVYSVFEIYSYLSPPFICVAPWRILTNLENTTYYNSFGFVNIVPQCYLNIIHFTHTNEITWLLSKTAIPFLLYETAVLHQQLCPKSPDKHGSLECSELHHIFWMCHASGHRSSAVTPFHKTSWHDKHFQIYSMLCLHY